MTMMLLLAVIVAAQQPSSNAERYESVRVDDAGQLHILTTGGREIIPRKDGDQVGFEDAAVSPDKKAVAWEGSISELLHVVPDPGVHGAVLGRQVHKADPQRASDLAMAFSLRGDADRF